MRKSVIVAVACAALAGAAQARADTVLFDTNGAGANGPGSVVSVSFFDWLPGNSILLETSPTTATLLYQANLGTLNGTPVYTNGTAGPGSFFTAVASFSATLLGGGVFSIDPGGSFDIYANNAVASDLAGTGFTAGTSILSGVATADLTNLGSVITIPGTQNIAPNPAVSGCLPTGLLANCLDQSPNGNNYGAEYTMAALGSTHVKVNITSFDSSYFLNLLGGSLSFATTDSNNNLPYTHTDPSAQFFNGQIAAGTGPSTATICGPGGAAACVNGTGNNIMAEADASTSFQGVTTVPEPASLTLLGLGLLGSAAARRRQKNAKK